MSIFNTFRRKPQGARAPQAARTEKPDRPPSRTIASKPNDSTPRLSAVADKDLGVVEDDAITNLKNSFAKVEAEKRENAYVYPHAKLCDTVKANLV